MTRTFRFLAAAFLISMFAGSAQAARGNEVEMKLPTVAVPADVSKAQVRRAVHEALVMRGWRVTDSNPEKHYVEAEIAVRVHVARVRVNYAGEAIQMEHREGVELPVSWKVPAVQALSGMAGAAQWQVVDERPARGEAYPMVHARYNEWLEELAITLDGTLGLARL